MLSAVVLGAFGAHGLKNIISTESIAVFKTGVFYQFVHALAIFIVVLLTKVYKIAKLKWTIYFFTLGVLFFSGSLYLLSTKTYTNLEWSFLGPITPIGGVFFIFGWLKLMWEVFRNKKFEK